MSCRAPRETKRLRCRSATARSGGITLSSGAGKGRVAMRRSLTVKRAASAVALVVAGLGFARMGSAVETDADLVTEARQTMALYGQKDPGIEAFFRRSVGHVVFPSV